MILLIGYSGCGFTFLDWSLQFISGRDVVADPLTSSDSAHHHKPTHYIGAWRRTRESITYWVPGHQQHLLGALPDLQQYQIVCLKNPDHEEKMFLLSRIQQHMPHVGWYSDYQTALAQDLDPRAVDIVFSRAIDRYAGYLDFSVVHHAHTISLTEMFLSLDRILPELVQSLGMGIHGEKWLHWREIYQRWQEKNSWNHSPEVSRIFQGTTEEIPVHHMADATRWLWRFWNQ